MQVHQVTIYIVDHDSIGADEAKSVLETTRYPNHCMMPYVASVITKEIGEWDDSLPINNLNERDGAFAKLFK